jgi:hypothetical protein
MRHLLVPYNSIYILVLDDLCSVACPTFYVFCVRVIMMTCGIIIFLCDVSYLGFISIRCHPLTY